MQFVEMHLTCNKPVCIKKKKNIIVNNLFAKNVIYKNKTYSDWPNLYWISLAMHEKVKIWRNMLFQIGFIIQYQICIYMCRDHSGYGSAKKRQGYIATSSLIGWTHTQNDHCM